MENVQSKGKMVVVSLLVGFLGVDRKMLGYSNWWVKLVTFGGLGVWAFIDLVRIATGSLKMATGESLI